MAKRSPNYILILVLLLIAGIITYWAQFRSPVALTRADVHALPVELGNWTKHGSDGEVNSGVLKGWNVNKDNFLFRTYTNLSGGSVELMVVYKGLDRREWHLSEVCYGGSGSNVKQSIGKVPWASKSVKVVKLVAENENEGTKVISVYFFANGKHTESDFTKQQGSMLLSRLSPPEHGWAFVRVTSPVVTSEEDAQNDICEFLKSASDPLVRVLTCPAKQAGM